MSDADDWGFCQIPHISREPGFHTIVLRTNTTRGEVPESAGVARLIGHQAD